MTALHSVGLGDLVNELLDISLGHDLPRHARDRLQAAAGLLHHLTELLRPIEHAYAELVRDAQEQELLDQAHPPGGLS